MKLTLDDIVIAILSLCIGVATSAMLAVAVAGGL